MPNTPVGRQQASEAANALSPRKPSANAQLKRCLSLDATELESLAVAVESLAESQGWPPALAVQINLVLEEIIVNAIDYGYPDGRPGRIEVSLDARPAEIHIQIEDDGDAFDPFTQAPRPNVSAELADRPVGGLGLFLVRSYMDACAYRRASGRNLIDLVKRLPQPSP